MTTKLIYLKNKSHIDVEYFCGEMNALFSVKYKTTKINRKTVKDLLQRSKYHKDI